MNDLVSRICLGGAYLGTLIDKRASFRILDQFYENGGRIIDTANSYAGWVKNGVGGESEEVIGKWLEKSKYDDVVIMSKVGFEYGNVKRGLGYEKVIKECERSLKRLGVGQIDIYYAHLDDRTANLESTLKAFDNLKKEGKIKAIGASNYSMDRFKKAIAISERTNMEKYQHIQNHYTFLEPNQDVNFKEFSWEIFDDAYIDYSKKNQVTLFAHTSLLWGAYFNKFKYIWTKYDNSCNKNILNQINELASKNNLTASHLVIAWIMKKNINPIIGATTSDQIKETMQAFHAKIDDGILDCLDLLKGAGE